MSDKKNKTGNRPSSSLELNRREFIAGSTTAVAASALMAKSSRSLAAQQESTKAETEIRLSVNGVDHQFSVEDCWTLAEVLRDRLGLTGTKIGCDRSECGACTVLLDGQAVYSCSQLAVWLDGKSIRTVEGLAQGGQLSALQQAFVDHNGPQCGFCTPGQLMSATALLAANPQPSDQQVKAALVGNLCRCSNYNAIVEAVVAAGNGGDQEASV